METLLNQPQRDELLWQEAQKRVAFKIHLTVYLVVNVSLWAIWGFLRATGQGTSYPWPIWTNLGWGVGLASHYMRTFLFSEQSVVEREYQKLLKNR
jgi:2TM domain